MSWWTSIRYPLIAVAAIAAAYFTGGGSLAALGAEGGGAAAGAAGAGEAGALGAGELAAAGAGGATAGATSADLAALYGAEGYGSAAAAAGEASLPAVSVTGASPSLADQVLKYGPAVGALTSSGLNYAGQQQTNAANAQQAANQMSFQERLSGTAYQRAVNDMRAAGLNPMLGYTQGGASTPGGSQAIMGNKLGASVSGAQQGAKAVTELASVMANVDNTESDSRLKDAQTILAAAQTGQSRSTAYAADQAARATIANIPSLESKSKVDTASVGPDIAKREASASKEQALRGAAQLALPGLENKAEVEDKYRWMIQNVAPFMSGAGQAADLFKKLSPFMRGQ